MHAGAARAHGERIALMISLEMLGYYGDRAGSQRYPPLFRWFYPDRGNFLGFVSDLRVQGAGPGDLVGEGAAQKRAVIGETPNFAARL